MYNSRDRTADRTEVSTVSETRRIRWIVNSNMIIRSLCIIWSISNTVFSISDVYNMPTPRRTLLDRVTIRPFATFKRALAQHVVDRRFVPVWNMGKDGISKFVPASNKRCAGAGTVVVTATTHQIAVEPTGLIMWTHFTSKSSFPKGGLGCCKLILSGPGEQAEN